VVNISLFGFTIFSPQAYPMNVTRAHQIGYLRFYVMIIHDANKPNNI